MAGFDRNRCTPDAEKDANHPRDGRGDCDGNKDEHEQVHGLTVPQGREVRYSGGCQFSLVNFPIRRLSSDAARVLTTTA